MLDMGRAGISHIAAHTNLDAAKGGVNDTLMRVMGAENVRGEGFVRAGDVAEGTTFGQLCARAQKKLHASVRAFGNADTPRSRAGLLLRRRRKRNRDALALGADCFITAKCAITRRSTRWTKDAASSRQGTLKRKTRSAKCSPTLYKMRRMRYNIT